MTKVNKKKEALLPYTLLKELLCYEYETGLFYWLVSPARNVKAGQIAGNMGKDGYVRIGFSGHLYQAHRLAWTYTHGDYPEGEQPLIDHINGKKDDNRIMNLKLSSDGENSKNRKMQSRNTSGITGVHRYNKKRPSGKIDAYWRASWYDENDKQRMKSFPVHAYGENEAKQMAIDYRTKQLCLLEQNYGIKYSERHGI
jgi:hypothetical protein